MSHLCVHDIKCSGMSPIAIKNWTLGTFIDLGGDFYCVLLHPALFDFRKEDKKLVKSVYQSSKK